MSKIKEQYLLFYDKSKECYDDALRTCQSVWQNNECDNKCSLCPLQNIKSLYAGIRIWCEKGLTE